MSGVKLTKLDRRYNGHQLWSHRLEFRWAKDHSARSVKIFEVRDMLTKNFGTGCEVSEGFALKNAGIEVPVWGFNGDSEFFLREESLVLIELSKGRWE